MLFVVSNSHHWDRDERQHLLASCDTQSTLPGWLVVHVGLDPNQRGAVCTNVVLVGAELAAFRGDTLELLLTRSISVSNVHHHALVADGNAVELLDDRVADVSRLETAQDVRFQRPEMAEE